LLLSSFLLSSFLLSSDLLSSFLLLSLPASDELSAVESLFEELLSHGSAQQARVNVIEAASSAASNFFIFFLLFGVLVVE
jgi:hypothetical protein